MLTEAQDQVDQRLDEQIALRVLGDQRRGRAREACAHQGGIGLRTEARPHRHGRRCKGNASLLQDIGGEQVDFVVLVYSAAMGALAEQADSRSWASSVRSARSC
ncbi:hypothetical protein AB4142_25090 [Variovorax sp. 2RAF20]